MQIENESRCQYIVNKCQSHEQYYYLIPYLCLTWIHERLTGTEHSDGIQQNLSLILGPL